MPGDLYVDVPMCSNQRGITENQGSEITCLEDTAETMLRDAVPQREYVNEKRNPQTETPERADKETVACPDDTGWNIVTRSRSSDSKKL